MGWIRATLLEIWGLFVDDAVFAVSILVWLCVGAALAQFVSGPLGCVALFVGFAALLVQSAVMRAARR